MTPAVFLDTTVVRNFAAVARLDLLWTILRGRGRWTAAVAYEVEVAAAYVEGLDLTSVQAALGEPLGVNEPERVEQVERIRRAVFGGREDRPLQHLGEAETLVVLSAPQWVEARWVTDDRHAVRYARLRGLLVGETADLMADAVAMADLTAAEGDELLREMAGRGRGLRVPAARD